MELAETVIRDLRVENERLKADGDRLLAEAWAERDRALEERDQARADLAVTVEERERLRDENAELLVLTDAQTTIAIELDKVLAERDQARAVLDALSLVIDEVNDSAGWDQHWAAVGAAYHRARAGREEGGGG
jgi:hypothetical protein